MQRAQALCRSSSYLRGTCSHCFSPTAGAICEACGHPNDARTILDPQCSIDPGHALELREVDVVVLELERYRTELREFYVDKWRTWRPHPLRLVEELLEKPLPDYPVTYISDWGIPAPFPGCDGHVLNVWAEMLPGLMRTVEWVETQRGDRNVDGEALWHPASGNRLIQFLGYDNSFFFAVVHVVLALAIRDRCILPTSIMTNEFYQLENFKFSTSKNHAIWARDLLAQRSVDEVRFYLALSNPEFQKTNFAQAKWTSWSPQASQVLGRRWQPGSTASVAGGRVTPTSRVDISAETRALVEQLVGSFERYYAIETFSLQRVAEVFSQLLIWLGRRANAVADASPAGSGASQDASQVWMITRLIPSLVSPLLPDLAGRLDKVLAQTTCHQWPGSERLASGVTPVSTVGQILPPPRA